MTWMKSSQSLAFMAHIKKDAQGPQQIASPNTNQIRSPFPWKGKRRVRRIEVLFQHILLLGNRTVVPLCEHYSPFAYLTHWFNKKVNSFALWLPLGGEESSSLSDNPAPTFTRLCPNPQLFLCIIPF